MGGPRQKEVVFFSLSLRWRAWNQFWYRDEEEEPQDTWIQDRSIHFHSGWLYSARGSGAARQRMIQHSIALWTGLRCSTETSCRALRAYTPFFSLFLFSFLIRGHVHSAPLPVMDDGEQWESSPVQAPYNDLNELGLVDESVPSLSLAHSTLFSSFSSSFFLFIDIFKTITVGLYKCEQGAFRFWGGQGGPWWMSRRGARVQPVLGQGGRRGKSLELNSRKQTHTHTQVKGICRILCGSLPSRYNKRVRAV